MVEPGYMVYDCTGIGEVSSDEGGGDSQKITPGNNHRGL